MTTQPSVRCQKMDASASFRVDLRSAAPEGTSMSTKKLALAVISASLVFAFGMSAQAQSPTPSYSTSVTVGPVTPGGPYTATYSNCVPGETITFTQPQSTPATVTGVCAAGGSLGTATASFANAPTAAGDYTVTASGTQSPVRTITFSLGAAGSTVPATVPSGGLPATGSNGLGTATSVGLGLLVVGLGLLVVTQIRRRQPSVS